MAAKRPISDTTSCIILERSTILSYFASPSPCSNPLDAIHSFSATNRGVEFALGNKHPGMLQVHEADPAAHAALTELLEAPSLYDEFLRYLARRGYPIPERVLTRDVTRAHEIDPELTAVFADIYSHAEAHWDVYEACEELVDLEDNFQLWRFRHLKTVQRTIGMKTGTGGSSGVGFLQRALELTFFPELFAVRTEIGS